MELFNLFMQQTTVIKVMIVWILIYGVLFGVSNTFHRVRMMFGYEASQHMFGRVLDMTWYLMIIAVAVEFIIK